MENDSFDLPVPHVLLKPLWVDLVTVYLFTSWLFLYLFHLMAPKGTVCLCKGEDLLKKMPNPTL